MPSTCAIMNSGAAHDIWLRAARGCAGKRDWIRRAGRPHRQERRIISPCSAQSSRRVPRGPLLSHHRAHSSYLAVSGRLQRGVMGLETDEPDSHKPLQRHGFVGRRTARPTPPSLARGRRRPCPSCRYPASQRRSCLRLAVPIIKAGRGLSPPASTPWADNGGGRDWARPPCRCLLAVGKNAAISSPQTWWCPRGSDTAAGTRSHIPGRT
jgi:hypothetical protein